MTVTYCQVYSNGRGRVNEKWVQHRDVHPRQCLVISPVQAERLK